MRSVLGRVREEWEADVPVEVQVAIENDHVLMRQIRNGQPGLWVVLSHERANQLSHLLSTAAVEAQQSQGAK